MTSSCISQRIYSKDFGVDEGEDQAAIKHIILAGAHESGSAGECSADLGDVNACTECPTGTYSDEEGLGECKPCPFATYNDKKGGTEANIILFLVTRGH